MLVRSVDRELKNASESWYSVRSMMQRLGICGKHELPLDEQGECELCRLSGIPSHPPRSGSALWAFALPVLILLAGAAWAFSKVDFGNEQPVGVETQPRDTTSN